LLTISTYGKVQTVQIVIDKLLTGTDIQPISDRADIVDLVPGIVPIQYGTKVRIRSMPLPSIKWVMGPKGKRSISRASELVTAAIRPLAS